MTEHVLFTEMQMAIYLPVVNQQCPVTSQWQTREHLIFSLNYVEGPDT